MGKFIVRRLLWMFLTLFLLSLITFLLMHQVPGGPFDKEKRLPDYIMDNLNKHYRLDWPLWRQYVQYMYDVMIPRLTTRPPSGSLLDQFLIEAKLGPLYLRWMNFGPSYVDRSRTVNDILREQWPVSIQLGVLAGLLAIGIGIPLGILAAIKRNTLWDYLTMAFAISGMSLPSISMSILVVAIFGLWLRVLPISGWGAKPPYVLGFLPNTLSLDFLKFAILPAFVLGYNAAGSLARITRASLLEAIDQDYVRTARAKGLPERVVIVRHALRNSLIPVATVIGPGFAGLITGSFVIELIFGIPGLGRYFVLSIYNRDYAVIMGTILLYAVLLIIANAVVDITYAYLDPRIRVT